MPAKYKLVLRKDMRKDAAEGSKLYYASANTTGTCDVYELCDLISAQSTASSGDGLQTGVEVALGLQVEQGPHGLAALVAEGGALDDGDVPGLPVAGGVASVDALGAFLVILHGFASSLGLIEYLRPACKRRGIDWERSIIPRFPACGQSLEER